MTTSFLTPAHFIRILEVPEAERAAFDLSSLRSIVHGGAPCPVPVKRRIIEALPATEIWELYGASEGGATRISPAEWLERPGTVGCRGPESTCGSLDENGEPCAPGADGVIYIAPPGGSNSGRSTTTTTRGKTDAAWRDDAFTVGDVGHLDADGYLYITDRVSDMVIRERRQRVPARSRTCSTAIPRWSTARCSACRTTRHGEVVYAVVEARAQPSRPTNSRRGAARSSPTSSARPSSNWSPSSRAIPTAR